MRTMKHTFIAATLLLGCVAHAAQPRTQEVWQRHIDAWEARDVSAIVSDYCEGARIILNNQVYQGKAEIEDLFKKLFTLFDQAENHEIDSAIIIGKIVYITWRVTLGGKAYPLGTDTFVIENGKITYQTITSDRELFSKRTARHALPQKQ